MRRAWRPAACGPSVEAREYRDALRTGAGRGVGFAELRYSCNHMNYSHMKPLSGKRARIQRAEDRGVAAVDITLHATERRHLRRRRRVDGVGRLKRDSHVVGQHYYSKVVRI